MLELMSNAVLTLFAYFTSETFVAGVITVLVFWRTQALFQAAVSDYTLYSRAENSRVAWWAAQNTYAEPKDVRGLQKEAADLEHHRSNFVINASGCFIFCLAFFGCLGYWM